MVYIVLAAVAVFCFFFCFYILAKVENEPERHKPAWQDADADEEKQTITYRSSRRIREVEDKSTPWRHDPEEEKDEPSETGIELSDTVYDLSAMKEDLSETKRFSSPVRDGHKETGDDFSATWKFSPERKKESPAAGGTSHEQKEYPKSLLLRTLETLCGILFAVSMVLLIVDIILKM